jgi:hypothetical protein
VQARKLYVLPDYGFVNEPKRFDFIVLPLFGLGRKLNHLFRSWLRLFLFELGDVDLIITR